MLSRRVLGRAIKACAIKAGSRSCDQGVRDQGVRDQGLCHQGVCHQSAWLLKHVKGASTSVRVQILFLWPAESSHRSSWFWVCRCLTGRSGLDSLSKVRSGFAPCPVGMLGLVRFMLCRQIRSGFAPCLAGRSGQSVGRPVGWQYDAAWRHGPLELWRRALRTWGRRFMQVLRSGGAMQARRRGGTEIWRAAGVQAWSHTGMEVRRRAAGVGT